MKALAKKQKEDFIGMTDDLLTAYENSKIPGHSRSSPGPNPFPGRGPGSGLFPFPGRGPGRFREVPKAAEPTLIDNITLEDDD